MLILVAVAAGLALASLGGGLYEYLVVDPYWPAWLDLVQPVKGGINRKGASGFRPTPPSS